MTAHLRPALLLFVMLSALTGLAYPALVTGLAQVVFPSQANGSMIRDGDRVVGSKQIGQAFSDPRFFWSRPSAIGYAASTSSGTNQGPSNPALHDAVKSRIEALRAAGAPQDTPVPADLVTASGSGLDPHISPAAAFYQVPRVARARGLAEDELRRRVEARIESRTLGLLGEPRVNVLLLNLDLERD
jgi:potassium-transporting ATPase KdpC subunit